MTDSTNTPAAIQTDAVAATDAAKKAPEPKTCLKDMASRRIFDTTDLAGAYLVSLAETLSDFGDQDFAMVGIDPETGAFDPAIYTADTRVMVAKLKNQKLAKKLKAIVVAPVPTRAAILASAEALIWMDKILEKELNHVAVSKLREAEDISTVISEMPRTIDQYIASGRDSGGMIETFNVLYQQINAALAKHRPVWARAKLTKAELKKGMESKGYALEFHSALEDYKGTSLFDAAIALGKSSAERKGLDPTVFDRWAATRASKVYTVDEDDEDEAELDIDSLTDSLLAADAPKADEPATDPVPATA